MADAVNCEASNQYHSDRAHSMGGLYLSRVWSSINLPAGRTYGLSKIVSLTALQ